MWTVTIIFAGGCSISLIYEGEKAATDTYKNLQTLRNPTEDTYAPTATYADDYGSAVTIDIAEVVCHTLQDVKKVQTGLGELQLVQARMQAAIQNKAQRDPTLRMFMPPQGGLMS